MAVYLDDSGSHGYDALMSGTEGVDWNRSEANQTLELTTADGKSNSGFILPSGSAWMLIESYNIDDADSAPKMVRSLTEWWGADAVDSEAERDTLMTDFRTAMGLINGSPNYEAKATYFDGTDAHIHEADESTVFDVAASPAYTVLDYVPSTSSWEITNTLIAPEEESSLTTFMTVTTTSHTANPVTFTFKAPVGETIYVNGQPYLGEDDGNVAVSEDVGGDGIEFTIQETNANTITDIDIGGMYLEGSLPDISTRSNLTVFDADGNDFTGAIPDFGSANSALVRYSIYSQTTYGVGLSGGIPSTVSHCTSLERLYCYTAGLSGSIPDMSALTAMKSFIAHTNGLTSYTSGGSLSAITEINLSGNAITTVSEIDDILSDLVAGRTTTGVNINLSGGTNAIPTNGESNADRLDLVNNYSYTVSVNT